MRETNLEQRRGFLHWVSDLAKQDTDVLSRVVQAEGVMAQDALDAVQEAFTTFLRLPQARQLAGLHEDSRALLIVIARNVARNLRSRQRRGRLDEPWVDDMVYNDETPSVDELLGRAETRVQLRGCVDRLGEAQRHVVTLRMFQEASGPEVAARLDLSVGHVAVLLHRAKKELLHCMAG